MALGKEGNSPVELVQVFESPEGSLGVTVLQESTLIPPPPPPPGLEHAPALSTYPGTGILPLLADKDVQHLIFLQVEDAQDRHTVGPHHGVLPTFPTSRSIARDAATGQSMVGPTVAGDWSPAPCQPAGFQGPMHLPIMSESSCPHSPMSSTRGEIAPHCWEKKVVSQGSGGGGGLELLSHRARKVRD